MRTYLVAFFGCRKGNCRLSLIAACLAALGTLVEPAPAQSPKPEWQLTPAYGVQSGGYREHAGAVRTARMLPPTSDALVVESPSGGRDEGPVAAYAAEATAYPAEHGGPIVEDYGCEARPSRVYGCGPYGDACTPGGRFWFRADYLMWWTKGAHLPALASDGPLDVDGTRMFFGGDEVDPGVREGGRFALTYWTCPLQDVGIEGSYLFMGRKSVLYANDNAGTSTLGRPFLNADSGSPNFGMQDIAIVAQPGELSGRLDIHTGNELQVAELIVRRAIVQQCDASVDFLAGYRYARFAENLSIRSRSVVLPDSSQPLPTGTVINKSDLFTSGNDFNGAEVGLAAQRRGFRWSCDAYAKLALGGTRSRVGIDGSSSTSLAPAGTPGGLLAQPSNMGVYEQRSFTAMPEIGLNLTYDMTSRLKARFGYSLLYWSKIARPSEQVDLMVNTAQPAGLAAPQFRFIPNDFWAQGVNVGFDYSF